MLLPWAGSAESASCVRNLAARTFLSKTDWPSEQIISSDRPKSIRQNSSVVQIPRSHYLPRTRAGWIATVLLVVTMALAQPPVVHGLANRVEPWILGMPFLFVYLLGVYAAMIAVLIWTMSRKV